MIYVLEQKIREKMYTSINPRSLLYKRGGLRGYNAPIICIHGPQPTGMGGDSYFSILKSLVRLVLARPCGDKLMVTPLSPTPQEHITGVRVPM